MSLLAALKKATKHIYTILKMVNRFFLTYLKAQLVLKSVFTLFLLSPIHTHVHGKQSQVTIHICIPTKRLGPVEVSFLLISEWT